VGKADQTAAARMAAPSRNAVAYLLRRRDRRIATLYRETTGGV
jgi:hypothetical protein